MKAWIVEYISLLGGRRRVFATRVRANDAIDARARITRMADVERILSVEEEEEEQA